MNLNHNLTETEFVNIDVKFQLEHEIQFQGTKICGWIFDKINSMKIRFYKTGELNSSSYVKIPLRSNALINLKNNDKYCFIWSILAGLHPCETDHPNKVSDYKQNFDEINFEGFNYTNGIRCSVVHKFEKLNKLSVDIYELFFNKIVMNGNIFNTYRNRKKINQIKLLTYYSIKIIRLSLKNYMYFLGITTKILYLDDV